MASEKKFGWIAVDLDGTLAEYHGWRGIEHIGAPIPLMVNRVKQWIAEGQDVRIFTARVDGGQTALKMGDQAGEQCRDVEEVRRHIEKWCVQHIGFCLPVTNIKDYGMRELWDDRAFRVIANTGELCCEPAEPAPKVEEKPIDTGVIWLEDDLINHMKRQGHDQVDAHVIVETVKNLSYYDHLQGLWHREVKRVPLDVRSMFINSCHRVASEMVQARKHKNTPIINAAGAEESEEAGILTVNGKFGEIKCKACGAFVNFPPAKPGEHLTCECGERIL